MNELELRTRRLALRPVRPGDLETLLALRNEQRVLAGTATGEPLPVERMERQLERWLALWRERGFGTWMIELGGEPVGFVALDPMGEGYGDAVDPEAPEIGVVVHPDRWGSGIAGEAGTAVAIDCFDAREAVTVVRHRRPRQRAVAGGDGEGSRRPPHQHG